jgi:hypothetical protein
MHPVSSGIATHRTMTHLESLPRCQATVPQTYETGDIRWDAARLNSHTTGAFSTSGVYVGGSMTLSGRASTACTVYPER